jgi:hypothetical protein
MDEPNEELIKYLTETEEWNDIIVVNTFGEHEFLFSRFRTLNDEILEGLRPETKNLIDSLITPPAEVKQFKSEREYFYANGINVLGRHFVLTRYNLPFIFARDVNSNEELCIVKIKKIHSDSRYLILITYFMDYSSACVVSYLKPFLENYDNLFKVDDDHFNNINL